MRIKKDPRVDDSEELSMTPMIDIVFQLLIFFLLSAKFIALEGRLDSYLPKDKGLDNTNVPQEDIVVLMDLLWLNEGPEGKVLCRTANYRDPSTGAREDTHVFGTVDSTSTFIEYGQGPKRARVKFELEVPDFDEIETYLRSRYEDFQRKGSAVEKGLPVTVNFDNNVPTQMVVTLLDICDRVGIKNFTLNAIESPE